MKIAELKTPCALVDLDRLERNARRMSEQARCLGVRLRPHVKTHKCIEAARLQTAGEFGGITVSTLAEARDFAAAGFSDICYAVPVPTDRLDECVGLHRQLDAFHLLLDNRSTLARLKRVAAPHDLVLSIFLEVDVGGHRSGVDPESSAAVELAAAVDQSPNTAFAGILTHAGQAYACRDRAEVDVVARHERDAMLGFAHRLRSTGVEVPVVSIGSTPTATAADDLSGITEVRPGNYLFFDVFQSAIGSCRLDEIALSVVATVIGRDGDRGRAVVNAGALALSSDAGPTHVDAECGFGVPVSVDDQEPLPGLGIARLSQEHGVLTGPGAAELEPGDRLRILPNHSCLAAAMHGLLYVVRGDEVVDQWHPVRGW